MSALDRVVALVLWTSIVVFGLAGVAGVATSWFEFIWMYPVELVGDDVTVRNQMRFFKALELSWAVALFLLRRDLFVRRGPTLAVLFVFVATPMARGVSMLVDGLPHAHFVALFFVESFAASVLVLKARYAPAWRSDGLGGAAVAPGAGGRGRRGPGGTQAVGGAQHAVPTARSAGG